MTAADIPEAVDLLACGHPDIDPTVWHDNRDGEPVCGDCCPTCNTETPRRE